jgi:hypothetical protein
MNTDKLKVKAAIVALDLKYRLYRAISRYIDKNAEWYRRRTALIAEKAKNDAYSLRLKQLPLSPEWEPIDKNEVEVLGPYYQYDLDTGECLGYPENNLVSN